MLHTPGWEYISTVASWVCAGHREKSVARFDGESQFSTIRALFSSQRPDGHSTIEQSNRWKCGKKDENKDVRKH